MPDRRPSGVTQNPAIQDHLRPSHAEGVNCGCKVGCGKVGSSAALGIAVRFPLSHNLNNNITLFVGPQNGKLRP